MLFFIHKGGYIKNGVIYKNNVIYEKIHIRSGYPSIFICFNKHTVTVHLHAIVAFQKYGKDIFDTKYKRIHIRHLDGNKLNYTENNIAIGSPHDNMMDIPEEKRKERAIIASYANRKYTDTEVRSIIKDRKRGFTYRQLINKYKTSKSFLSYFFNKALYVIAQGDI